MSSRTRATIEDLHNAEGKAELVDGEIVEMAPSGADPDIAGGEIFAHLRDYAREHQHGRAFPDGDVLLVFG